MQSHVVWLRTTRKVLVVAVVILSVMVVAQPHTDSWLMVAFGAVLLCFPCLWIWERLMALPDGEMNNRIDHE